MKRRGSAEDSRLDMLALTTHVTLNNKQENNMVAPNRGDLMKKGPEGEGLSRHQSVDDAP